MLLFIVLCISLDGGGIAFSSEMALAKYSVDLLYHKDLWGHLVLQGELSQILQPCYIEKSRKIWI